MPAAPSSYTSHYSFRKWDEGVHPGSVALNANWDEIDAAIFGRENPLSFSSPLQRSSNTISILTGDLLLGSNTDGFSVSGTGKFVIGSKTINLPQRIDSGATPQFTRIGIGGAAHPTFGLYDYTDAYINGFLWVQGDLYVGGEITQVVENTLIVDDKTITVNNGGTTASAENAGFLVEGDSNSVLASIYYASASWKFSHDIDVVSGKGYKVNTVTVIDSLKNFFGAEGHFTSYLSWNGFSRSSSAFTFYAADGITPQTGKFKNLQVSSNYTGTIPTDGILFYTDVNLYRTTLSSVGVLATDSTFWFKHNTYQSKNKSYTSEDYVSGWGNTGFSLSTTASGVSTLIVDNLTVRRTMSVYELLIRQLRATNGSVIVSAATRFKTIVVTTTGTTYEPTPGNILNGNIYTATLDADDQNYITFSINDIVVMQIWSGRSITASWGIITSINNSSSPYTCTIFYIPDVNYSSPATAHTIAKDRSDWIRVGNYSDATRQGMIYITADDDDNPFIDVRGEVNSFETWNSSSTKVRLGNLKGISGSPYGEKEVYGLYADVAWLTDNVIVGGHSLGLLNGMTALFHFDNNLRDSISGSNATYSGTFNETADGVVSSSDNSLICTKVNGKFGGGIAIEEATTNLITYGDFEFDTVSATNWSFWGSGTRAFTTGYHGKGYYMEGSASAVGLSSSGFTATAGTSYTIQVKVKGDHLNYFYILKSSGNINISSLATKTYLEGDWYQLTYTATSSTTETWNILFAFYNYAKGIIDEAQVEAKSFATSFTKTSRSAGVLHYSNIINPSAWTCGIWVYIDFNKSHSNGRIFEISPDGSNKLFVNRFGSTSQLQIGFQLSGTYLIPANYKTVTLGWHHVAASFDGSGYSLFVDGTQVYYYELSSQVGSSWLLRIGEGYNLTGYLNGFFDELTIFNRALSENEIKRIYYSDQPFQESPGLTYISGNRIKTGYMQSENYVSNAYGMIIGLNDGYMELNYDGDNIFKFQSATSTAKIAAFTFNKDYFTDGHTYLGSNLSSVGIAADRLLIGYYNSSNPIAIVMGSGSVGGYLEIGLTNTNVFFFRLKQAGVTVFEVLPTTAKIFGYSFDSTKAYAGNSSAGIVLSQSSTAFLSGTSSVGFEVWNPSSPKLFIGKKDGNHLDWNVTVSNTLTIVGTVQSSQFSTDAYFGSESPDNSYAVRITGDTVKLFGYTSPGGTDTIFRSSYISSESLYEWKQYFTSTYGSNSKRSWIETHLDYDSSTGSYIKVAYAGNGTSDAAAQYMSLTPYGLYYMGTRLVWYRRTGWTAATGTATRTAFATSTVTLSQLAERVKALIDDLIGHGLIGT